MVEKKKDKTKKGFVVMQTPNEQKAYVTSRKVDNMTFYFHRKEESKKGECVISKNLRKDYHYDNKGNELVVQEHDWQSIVRELEKQGMVKKPEKANSNSAPQTSNS